MTARANLLLWTANIPSATAANNHGSSATYYYSAAYGGLLQIGSIHLAEVRTW